ncbi:hypothetical protein HHI36_012318 [Cryptolaemus montrouzieri]|uniref:Uncharacterized protein n=1 Tax=Cryptolaemus montrouzieri TaxID=559131 RepID=A0ABD2NE89_9CUCU
MVEEQSIIPTRASMLKGISKIEEVSFVSYKPKPKKIINDDNDNNLVIEKPAFVMKKAKNEIIKFGISQLEGQEKEMLKYRAKPPRKKCVNYKKLLKERKESNINEKSNVELQQIGKNTIGKSTAKTKFDKKRKKDLKLKDKGLLDVYGRLKVKVT